MSVLLGQDLQQGKQLSTDVAKVKKTPPLQPPKETVSKVEKQKEGDPAKDNASPINLTTSPLLEVTLETTRPLTLGDSRQGVYATLRNNSQKILRFRQSSTAFVLSPSEGAGTSVSGGCVTFPTLSKSDESLTLQPSESYTIVWDLESETCETKGTTFPTIFDAKRIRGGVYKVIFNSQYEFDNAAKQSEAHHITKVIEARFPAPFSSVMIFSFLGGIAAYWVKKFMLIPPTVSMAANIREADWAKSLTAIFGSGILSMVLVILGTQAGDTAFPLKLDVSSLVGAFTSGFLLNFAGDRVMEWLGKLGRA